MVKSVFRRGLATIMRTTHMDVTKTVPRENVLAAATVKEIKNVTKSVKQLTLRIPEPQFTFKAGQWVDFFIPGVQEVGGFSMTSSPQRLQKDRTLDLAVKQSSWIPSTWIHEKCREGDQVQLRVGGNFSFDRDLQPNIRNLVLIAGGVGINPLQSILEYCNDLESNTMDNVILLQSARTKDELLFQSRHKELAQQLPMLTKYFLTRDLEKPNPRITYSDFLVSVGKGPISETAVYVCGPKGMIETVHSWVKKANFPEDILHLERWW